MATRKIVTQEDEILHKVCRPVTDFNDRLHILLDDMRETLIQANGVGLAAPQVGILRRAVLVINEDDEVMELINPEILAQKGEQRGPEGCLSIPGKCGMVTRPSWVRIRAQDRFGDWYEAEGEGLTARAFCHELEHLDGHLYNEHIDRYITDEELEAYYREHGDEPAEEEK